MRLSLDTANIDDIRQAVKLGAISGVTSDPSLASKEGTGTLSGHRDAVLEIAESPYLDRAVSSANPDGPTPAYRPGAVEIFKGLGRRCEIVAG